MKLRNKILIVTGVIWAIFFILISPILFKCTSTLYASIYIGVGILFYFLTYFLIQHYFLKRIEKLNSELLQKNNSDDEISSLVTHFNQMKESLVNLENKISQDSSKPSNNDLTTDSESLNTSKELHVQLAHYDNLTTLPNLVFFNEILDRSLGHASRHNKILAILLINLDHFKNVNAALGNKAGDEVLKEIAKRFSTTLRSGDIMARISGDEFIVLLNDINHPKFASHVAEKLLQTCSKAININNRDIFLSASIGICIFPHDGASLEDLQKKADLALTKAKKSGGSIYQYFTNEMTLEANKHIQLDNALHKAINNHEFEIYYQPKLKLANGTIAGTEALIRWNNPNIGMVNPLSFIPQAEESGLMMEIGEWVLKEACRACKNWQMQGYEPITVAVNLSPKQFNHHDLIQVVKKVLDETGLEPQYLELEITEMTIMEDVELAAQKLQAIKKMGVRLCIDDFGTGYTSISYLKKFPIDVIKVDQNFIKGIPQNQNDIAITTAIISLGHNLGMQVVAEGVESIEQVRFLADHDCDLVQGYYFSRPLPEQKMVLQLKKVE